MIDRRSVLTAAVSSLALSALGLPLRILAAASELKLGKPQPFSFDGLVQEMQQRATTAYVRDKTLPQGVLDRIGYDEHGKLKFSPDHALFRDGPAQYPVTFFALGKYFRTPVHMFVLSAAGDAANASEILYDPAYFSMPPNSPARELPKGAGFSGFRLQESRLGDVRNLDWHSNDWAAFLGASYFAASASWASMVCPRAASPWMYLHPAGRKNFPTSPASTSSQRRTAPTRWWSTRRSTAPASRVPIDSCCTETMAS